MWYVRRIDYSWIQQECPSKEDAERFCEQNEGWECFKKCF